MDTISGTAPPLICIAVMLAESCKHQLQGLALLEDFQVQGTSGW